MMDILENGEGLTYLASHSRVVDVSPYSKEYIYILRLSLFKRIYLYVRALNAPKKVRDLTTPLVTNVYLFWRDLTTPRVTYFHFGDQQCGQLLCCLSPARW